MTDFETIVISSKQSEEKVSGNVYDFTYSLAYALTNFSKVELIDYTIPASLYNLRGIQTGFSLPRNNFFIINDGTTAFNVILGNGNIDNAQTLASEIETVINATAFAGVMTVSIETLSGLMTFSSGTPFYLDFTTMDDASLYGFGDRYSNTTLVTSLSSMHPPDLRTGLSFIGISIGLEDSTSHIQSKGSRFDFVIPYDQPYGGILTLDKSRAKQFFTIDKSASIQDLKIKVFDGETGEILYLEGPYTSWVNTQKLTYKDELTGALIGQFYAGLNWSIVVKFS